MGTGLRSQSLRGPRRHSYRKLQEPWGRPLKGQLRRAVSLREGREKSRSQDLDGGTDVQKVPAQKSQPAGSGEDTEQLTEQLIQTPPRGCRWWLRRCQQVRAGAEGPTGHGAGSGGGPGSQVGAQQAAERGDAQLPRREAGASSRGRAVQRVLEA
ncbi:uncharacterized protein C11orf86 homolog [Urocitellus parryii]